MKFAGLAAAIAFIAGSPSTAALTEQSVDQFHQRASLSEASQGPPAFAPDARNAGGFRLAQSTQGDDNGECYPSWGDCGGSEDDFQFQFLPNDPPILEFEDLSSYDENKLPPPPNFNPLRAKLFGPRGLGISCLASGGALMISVKTYELGCWRRIKAAPVIGLRIPALDSAAQRVLTNCRFSSGSVTLRNGAFACIATPRAVVRMAAKGTELRRSPVRTPPGGEGLRMESPK